MKEDIEIKVDGKVLSRVVSGPDIAGVAQLLEGYPRVWMVYDANVASHAAKVAGVLKQETESQAESINEKGMGEQVQTPNLVSTLAIETSEESKNIATVLEIEKWLLETGADRDALLLAVGGGITTDMAGFSASIYKRGIRFAFIPTTLLSQVDAAIGGKTGVNFESLKNMIGVIRQPDFTYICPDVLETLPARDFRSGAAEMLKTFIIEDGGNYEKAVQVLSEIAGASISDINTNQPAVKACMSIPGSGTKQSSGESDMGTSDINAKLPAGEVKTSMPDGNAKQPAGQACSNISAHQQELQELISAAAAVKAGIVSRDQFESGERRKLNLGHTFAHAIEWKARETGSDITHGEAVAIGIIQAAKLTDGALAAKLKADFTKAGLPTELPFPLEDLAAAMLKDKKAEGGKVHFVLIRTIGDVYTEDMTVAEAISKL
jgi:3-dehydroquinate synthetase